jgi:hypothetical protein
MVRLVGTAPFAPSDIGYLGMICRFGLFGAALLIFLNVYMCEFTRRVLSRRTEDPVVAQTLVDLLVYVMICEILSTYIIDGGGAIFLALSIGYYSRVFITKGAVKNAVAAYGRSGALGSRR